jgi:hypothetical protein
MDCIKQWLEISANIAAIFTAIVAVIAWVSYKCSQCEKMRKLEDYLKKEKEAGNDKAQRSILHLVANVGLTEEEIIKASFKSRHIKRRLTTNEKTGLADSILLEYE